MFRAISQTHAYYYRINTTLGLHTNEHFLCTTQDLYNNYLHMFVFCTTGTISFGGNCSEVIIVFNDRNNNTYRRRWDPDYGSSHPEYPVEVILPRFGDIGCYGLCCDTLGLVWLLYNSCKVDFTCEFNMNIRKGLTMDLNVRYLSNVMLQQIILLVTGTYNSIMKVSSVKMIIEIRFVRYGQVGLYDNMN